MEAYQQRVVDEKTELDAKLSRLDDFLRSEKFESLTERQKSLMHSQQNHMRLYSDVLGMRIADFMGTAAAPTA